MSAQNISKEVGRVIEAWSNYFAAQTTADDHGVFDDYLKGLRDALVKIPTDENGEADSMISAFLSNLVSSFEELVRRDSFNAHSEELFKILVTLKDYNQPLGHEAVKTECQEISRTIRMMMKCFVAGIAYRNDEGTGWHCIDAQCHQSNETNWLCLAAGTNSLSFESEQVNEHINNLRNNLDFRSPVPLNLAKVNATATLHDSISGRSLSFYQGTVVIQSISEFEQIAIFALGEPNKEQLDFNQPTINDDLLLQTASLFVRAKFREFGPATIYALTHPAPHRAAFISGNLRAFKVIKTENNLPEEIVSLLREYHSKIHIALGEQGGHILHELGDTFIAAIPGTTEQEAYSKALNVARRIRALWQEYNPTHPKPRIALGISGDAAQVLCVNHIDGRRLLATIGRGISNARLLQRCAGAADCAILVDSTVHRVLKDSAFGDDFRIDANWDQLWQIIGRSLDEEESFWPEPWRSSLELAYTLEQET